MLVNPVLYSLGSIRDIYGAIQLGAAHLAPAALQRREELTEHQGGFPVPQPGSDIPGHAEISILVDGAGDETGHVGGVQHGGEGRGEGGGCLHRREPGLAYVVRPIEPEYRSRLHTNRHTHPHPNITPPVLT